MIEGCAHCDNTETCEECDDGWELLDDGTCFNSFCAVSDENTNECLICQPGYHHVWDRPIENCYPPILSAFNGGLKYDFNPLSNTYIWKCEEGKEYIDRNNPGVCHPCDHGPIG